MSELDPVRNVTFNPMFVGSLQSICERHSEQGYELIRVVQATPYEAVAVFVLYDPSIRRHLSTSEDS